MDQIWDNFCATTGSIVRPYWFNTGSQLQSVCSYTFAYHVPLVQQPLYNNPVRQRRRIHNIPQNTCLVIRIASSIYITYTLCMFVCSCRSPLVRLRLLSLLRLRLARLRFVCVGALIPFERVSPVRAAEGMPSRAAAAVGTAHLPPGLHPLRACTNSVATSASVPARPRPQC